FFISLLFGFLAACGSEPPPAETAAQQPAAKPAISAWAAFRGQFIEEYLAANPTLAIDLGRHEFDGQMPKRTAAAQAAYSEQLHTWMRQANAVDAGAMSNAEFFEREYLLSDLEKELFWLDEVKTY